MVRPVPGSVFAALLPAAVTRFVEPRAALADFFPTRRDDGFRGVGMTSHSLGMETTAQATTAR